MAGAVAGLLLALTDSADGLGARLLLLVRTTATMLVLGHFLGGDNWLFWSTFAILTLVTGWLSQPGSSGAATLRLGDLALISMAGLREAGASTVWMVLIAAGASALARVLGSLLFPHAALISSAVPRAQDAEGNPAQPDEPVSQAGLRFCLVYAATAAFALLLGSIEGVARPMWVATTVLLVMQPQSCSSYERIAQRAFGTLVGVLLAALIALLMPHGISRNHWLQAALVALLILVLYDLAASGHRFDSRLFSERIWAACWV